MNLKTSLISEREVVKLSMLMWRYKKIAEKRFNKPTLFSEYIEMVKVLSIVGIII